MYKNADFTCSLSFKVLITSQWEWRRVLCFVFVVVQNGLELFSEVHLYPCKKKQQKKIGLFGHTLKPSPTLKLPEVLHSSPVICSSGWISHKSWEAVACQIFWTTSPIVKPEWLVVMQAKNNQYRGAQIPILKSIMWPISIFIWSVN